ncbi:hypothetical protein M404DRAFT_740641 [Pisolithus tinctorius Marx 270]|uniref:Uncharacterized protein n=1 Tax=Pisolithus tinctorius Marx 270 TaxID=870435 RepID=A0A0C3P0K7_PISTI|nr:hypothetical protein M404DRAFT_740641 [Pisolithus tinctorius Marx 270]
MRNSDTTSFSAIFISARVLTFVPFPTRQPSFHYVIKRGYTSPFQSYQSARRRSTRMKYPPVTISLSYYILSLPSRWGGARVDQSADGCETGMRRGCILSSHEDKGYLRVSEDMVEQKDLPGSSARQRTSMDALENRLGLDDCRSANTSEVTTSSLHTFLPTLAL